MERDGKFGAGQIILIGVFTALLLLWMDGWSHSVPVMVVTAAIALFVYLGFRKSKPRRNLTHAEQIMLERESARRWLMTQQRDPEPEPKPPEPKRPKLQLIDGGKSDDSESDLQAEEEPAEVAKTELAN